MNVLFRFDAAVIRHLTMQHQQLQQLSLSLSLSLFFFFLPSFLPVAIHYYFVSSLLLFFFFFFFFFFLLLLLLGTLCLAARVEQEVSCGFLVLLTCNVRFNGSSSFKPQPHQSFDRFLIFS